MLLVYANTAIRHGLQLKHINHEFSNLSTQVTYPIRSYICKCVGYCTDITSTSTDPVLNVTIHKVSESTYLLGQLKMTSRKKILFINH